MSSSLALFILLFSRLVLAESTCVPISAEELRKIVDEVQLHHYPELNGISFPFVDCKSENYFFQASVSKASLLKGKKKYFIEVNKKLLNCPPSEAGLRAIITHELAHFRDYEKLRPSGLMKLGIHYTVSMSFRRGYERQTDLTAIHMGEGRGLIDYRLWLYERLSPKGLRLKKIYYLNPSEIESEMTKMNSDFFQ